MALLIDALRDLSGIVGVPLALNAADMTPVTSLPHRGLLDGSRMAMLLGQAVSVEVRAHLVSDGAILERHDPRRIDPVPGLELGRVHVPVRDAGGRLVGHIWAIDPDHSVAVERWWAVRDASARALSAAGWTVDSPTTSGDPADRVLRRFITEHRVTRIVSVTVAFEGVVDPESLISGGHLPVFRPEDGPSRTSVVALRDELANGVLLVGSAQHLAKEEWTTVLTALRRRIRSHVGSTMVRLT